MRGAIRLVQDGDQTIAAFFNSVAPTSPKLVSTFMHSDFFSSVCEAKASASPPLVKAFAPDFFIAFIGAMLKKLAERLLQDWVQVSWRARG